MTNGIVRALTCRVFPAYKCPSPHEKRPGSGNAHFRKGVRRLWCNAGRPLVDRTLYGVRSVSSRRNPDCVAGVLLGEGGEAGIVRRGHRAVRTTCVDKGPGCVERAVVEERESRGPTGRGEAW